MDTTMYFPLTRTPLLRAVAPPLILQDNLGRTEIVGPERPQLKNIEHSRALVRTEEIQLSTHSKP